MPDDLSIQSWDSEKEESTYVAPSLRRLQDPSALHAQCAEFLLTSLR